MDPSIIPAIFDTASFCLMLIIVALGSAVVGFLLGVTYAIERTRRGR